MCIRDRLQLRPEGRFAYIISTFTLDLIFPILLVTFSLGFFAKFEFKSDLIYLLPLMGGGFDLLQNIQTSLIMNAEVNDINNCTYEFQNETLTIKVKDKIVADGLGDSSFDITNKGIHLNAKQFNELMKKEDSVVIDMRNHYESEIGHFKDAILPDVDTFRDSLDIIEKQMIKHKDDKNLLMYCTGGIRCEKASAYFKHKGFRNVYQLEGGIIEYIRQVKEENLENNFLGKNFVFDNRRAEKISNDIIAACHQCGSPYDIHTNCANDACHLLFIQCDNCRDKMENCCSYKCLEIKK